jgi:16S rRNA (cytosine967-C5)-methyltransferase
VGLKPSAAGIAARRAAVELLDGVLGAQRPLDDMLDDPNGSFAGLTGRDRSFAHAIAATALRRKGEADAYLALHLKKPLPRSAGTASLILLSAITQLVFLAIPAHAVIHQSVSLAQGDVKAHHFAGLINAILRKIASTPPSQMDAGEAARLNTPTWLWTRWVKTYGEETASLIGQAHARQPPTDITTKDSPSAWAEKLGGMALPTGSIRLAYIEDGVTRLSGFAQGEWWVQDAAAALPVRILGDVSGLHVADLCAAPGGKTAQLLSAGARVTAVDASRDRLARMNENLTRLHLSCDLVHADVLEWAPAQQFDAILLDAPCSATGTIRRHPDLPYVKSATQIATLAKLQVVMIQRSAAWLKPGGMLLYSTCSLEPEEGESQVRAFLGNMPGFERLPLDAGMIGGQSNFINKNGDLRTHPGMMIGSAAGLDGFFACRLRRRLAF